MEFMYKRGSYRDTWHPTLRALGVAAMRRDGRLDPRNYVWISKEHPRLDSRNTPVMRAAAVWHEVVGGSEKAKAPNW